MDVDAELANASERLKQLPANEQGDVRQYIDFLLDCKRRGMDTWSLLELRESIPFTQADLAEFMGVSPTTISQAERGKVSPELERKIRLFLMAKRLDKEDWIKGLLKGVTLNNKPPGS